MNDRPLVSAIIPVRNGEAYLAEAIESVLGQTWAPVEVLVVDDGSSDRSAAVAESFSEVRVLRQSPQGPGAARNTAVAASCGQMLAFLDADDLWPPNKLELQVGHLLEHPDVDLVLGRQRVFAEPGVPFPPWFVREGGLEHEAISPQPLSLVTHRQVWDRVGEFATGMLYADDTDWLLRAAELGLRIEILEETVLHRRIHTSNVSNDDDSLRRGLALALKARIDRRRARAAS